MNAFDYSAFVDQAGSFNLVSFDVFDTLLHRVCSPERLIALTNRRLAEAIGATEEEIARLRDALVKRLRSERHAAGSDGEYRYSELVDAMALQLSSRVEIETVRTILNAEVDNECLAVFANEGMIDAARRIKAAGGEVVAISDMYHSAGDIWRILAAVGAEDVFSLEAIHVSSENFLTKASGRLFPHVQYLTGVAAARHMHVGDNIHSDVKVARRMGMAAVHFDAGTHHFRYSQDIKALRSRANLALIAHHSAMSGIEEGSCRSIVAALAPAICHFALAVRNNARQDAVSKVWFLARDGFLPKSVYDMFSIAPVSGYLYVSRKSVLPASSPSYGFREAFTAQWNGESSSLRSLLAPVGISEAEKSNLASTYGFTGLEENVDFRDDPRFHRLVSSNVVQDAMRAVYAESHRALTQYLVEEGFASSRREAVVDVGWAGQIQEALAFALRSENVTDVVGYYMALRELGGKRRASGLAMKGLIYDCDEPDWNAEAILYAVDVFEDTCRAHHGTVTGYKEGKPLLAKDTPSRQVEVGDEPRLAHLQRQILLYAKRWVRFVELFEINERDSIEVAKGALSRFLRFPSKEEADFFTSVGHSLGAAADVVLENVTITSRWAILPTLRAAKYARWKEAAVAHSCWRVPFQFVVALFRLRRNRTSYNKETSRCDVWGSPSERIALRTLNWIRTLAH
jgi:predicted HAD superfamily hydrolase